MLLVLRNIITDDIAAGRTVFPVQRLCAFFFVCAAQHPSIPIAPLLQVMKARSMSERSHVLIYCQYMLGWLELHNKSVSCVFCACCIVLCVREQYNVEQLNHNSSVINLPALRLGVGVCVCVWGGWCLLYVKLKTNYSSEFQNYSLHRKWTAMPNNMQTHKFAEEKNRNRKNAHLQSTRSLALHYIQRCRTTCLK